MPQLKQVDTLSDACISNVIKHMNTFWVAKSKIKDLIDSETHMLYLVGPFDILNESIVHRIMKKLEENGELNRYNLFILMHFRLAKIDFTLFKNKSIINIPRLFEFIGTNCHVSIAGGWKKRKVSQKSSLLECYRSWSVNASQSESDDDDKHAEVSAKVDES